MARMTSKEGLSLDIKVLEVCAECGWTRYEVLLLWRDKPIINNDVLRSDSLHWSTRTPGALVTSQYDGDRSLVLVIRAALETGKKSYWQPLDPTVSITIRRPTIHCDEFKLAIFADVNAFVGCEYYTGNEISLTITVTGESLTEFYEELERERKELGGLNEEG